MRSIRNCIIRNWTQVSLSFHDLISANDPDKGLNCSRLAGNSGTFANNSFHYPTLWKC